MKLPAEEQARTTQNPEAYKLYLEGRFFWNKRNSEAITKAKELFEQAIRLDPEFALAYSGLADAYNLLGEYHVLAPVEGLARSEEAARAALRLDPTLAEAYASLGRAESSKFHWEAAKRELQRAMEINPNYASALQWYSQVLLAQGHIDESVATIQRAEQIDPLSAFMAVQVAHRLIVKGDYAAALAEAQKAQELDPGLVWAYWNMGMAYEGLGELEKAAAAYKKGADVPGPVGGREVLLILAHANLGNRTEARRLAQLLENRAARGEISQTWTAWSYAALGDREKAFLWMNRALEAREGLLSGMIRTPVVKELRGDPRYTELLGRLERGFED